MGNLLTDVELRRVMNRDSGTAGTKKATIVDMEGFDEVTFVIAFQTVTNASEVTLQVAQAAINNTSNMVVSTGKLAKVTSDGTIIALSNKQLALAVTKPKERYLELQVVIGEQTAVIDHITAILSKPRKRPTVQGATVVDSTIHQSPGAA